MEKKELEKQKLLFALIKGAKRSDRELAKEMKCSQPTVTRKRAKLEKEGYIKEYTLIPDLVKMGHDFIAVTFLSFSEYKSELFDKAREWANERPSIIYAVNGEGMGMNSIMISVHRDYGSYSKLITDLRRDWEPNLRTTKNFMISLTRPDLLVKPFSFRHLEDNL